MSNIINSFPVFFSAPRGDRGVKNHKFSHFLAVHFLLGWLSQVLISDKSVRKGGEMTKPLPKGQLTLKKAKALRWREKTYRWKNLWMSNLYTVTETLNVILWAVLKAQERKIPSSVYSATQMLYRIVPMETFHLNIWEWQKHLEYRKRITSWGGGTRGGDRMQHEGDFFSL